MKFFLRPSSLAGVSEAPLLILLYYKYTVFEDPEAYAQAHRELCGRLGLKGRILVAREGLNGTVSGAPEACRRYQEALEEDERTKGVHWKVDEGHEDVIPRLSVKLRDEVVSLGLAEDDFNPIELTATHLKPEEWREIMKDENTVMITYAICPSRCFF